MYILAIYTTDDRAMVDFSTLEGFEWDSGNMEKNWVLHKVTWTEIEEAFFNQPTLTYPDAKHSHAEERFYALGRTGEDRWLQIVFTIRKNRIRVISARDMSKNERKLYHEALEKDT
jgi:hypothetical protein